MTDLNHLVLIGRLTQDLGADERSFGYVGNGQARANVSIAVNSSKKQGDQWVDEVNYFNITIWGKTAENLKPYLTKGKQICVEGHLKQDRWEKDGQKQSRINIVADNVQLLGGKDNNSAPNSTYAQQYQNQQNGMAQVQQMAGQTVQTRQAQQIQPHNDGFQEDLDFGKNEYPDNDIPF